MDKPNKEVDVYCESTKLEAYDDVAPDIDRIGLSLNRIFWWNQRIGRKMLPILMIALVGAILMLMFRWGG